jgi:hypothetical protein
MIKESGLGNTRGDYQLCFHIWLVYRLPEHLFQLSSAWTTEISRFKRFFIISSGLKANSEL